MFKKIAFTTTALISVCLPAIASDFELVKIADDASGTPVMIDIKSIEGDNFTLYQNKYGHLVEMQFDASCPEGRVWLRRMTLYSSTGAKVSENTELKPMPASANTPTGIGLRYFCRAFKVPGY